MRGYYPGGLVSEVAVRGLSVHLHSELYFCNFCRYSLASEALNMCAVSCIIVKNYLFAHKLALEIQKHSSECKRLAIGVNSSVVYS